MEVFKLCRKYFFNAGIDPHQSSSKHPFNTRNAIALTMSTICVTSNIIFLLHDAKTFEEYTNTIYVLSTAVLGKTNYSIALWKSAECFHVFDSFQNVINKSEWMNVNHFHFGIEFHFASKYRPSIRLLGLTKCVSRTIYAETNSMVEKWCQITHSFIVKITPIFLGAQFLTVGFFMYFTTDLGNDAFELQFPTW